MPNQARVGVGIIIENEKGEILVGKRKGSHAPYFSIPGGSLEVGETFEAAAIREAFEETGLKIANPQVINVTNNLRTYQESGLHFVSINLYVSEFTGIAKVMEPQKCEMWLWVNPNDLPKPHFDASEYAVDCFLADKFYHPLS